MVLLRSSLIVVTPDGSLVKRRRGVADVPVSTVLVGGFTVGTTRPTVAAVGPDSAPRVPYTGPNAGGLLNITTPGAVFDHVDFGNTKLKLSAANISLNHCTQNITDWVAASVAVDCRSSAVSNARIFRCDFNNTSQDAVSSVGVTGDRFTLERSRVRNFVDLVNIYPHSTNLDGPTNTAVLGNYFSDLAFFWAPTTGIVHPSSLWVHADVIQHQGGRGTVIRGNFIGAYYSTTVGTGTPRSGAEYGWAVGYSQAEGEAKRQEIVFGNGTIPSGLGGSISGLMFNNDRGGTPLVTVTNNWGGGGSYWLNAGETWTAVAGVTNNFGVITGNVVKRDQRVLQPVTGGLPVVFGIHPSGIADVRDNYVANDDWTPSATLIARQSA